MAKIQKNVSMLSYQHGCHKVKGDKARNDSKEVAMEEGIQISCQS